MSQKQFEFSGETNGRAPEDAGRRGHGRRKRAPPASQSEQPARREETFRPRAQPVTRELIGKLSDCGHRCERCDADEYDVVEERFSSLLAECAFCGALCVLGRPSGFRSPVIRGGQLNGLTVRQAVAVNRRMVEHLSLKNPWILEALREIGGSTVAE
jgi:hypothetical protein